MATTLVTDAEIDMETRGLLGVCRNDGKENIWTCRQHASACTNVLRVGNMTPKDMLENLHSSVLGCLAKMSPKQTEVKLVEVVFSSFEIGIRQFLRLIEAKLAENNYEMTGVGQRVCILVGWANSAIDRFTTEGPSEQVIEELLAVDHYLTLEMNAYIEASSRDGRAELKRFDKQTIALHERYFHRSVHNPDSESLNLSDSAAVPSESPQRLNDERSTKNLDKAD